MSAYQLPVWVWPTALMGVCLLALWRGRDEERLAVAGQLAAWALTMVVYRARSADIQWGMAIVDLGLLVLLLYLAMRTPRFWPLFAAAFQLLSVVTHVARGLDSGISGWAYVTAGIVWSYMVIAAIGYGAWTAPRAQEDLAGGAAGSHRR